MQNIKKIYLYTVSVIALVIAVIGAIMLLNMALKTWVFPKADQGYYYPPTKVDCEAYKASEVNKGFALPPECTDPNFAENQRKAEEDNRKAQKQRDAAMALSMLIIAAPVWYFHWRLARKEA